MPSNHLQTMGRNSSTANTGLQQDAEPVTFGYGQYDPRMPKHQFLNSLRNLPPPWKCGKEVASKSEGGTAFPSPFSLLPSSCLLPYYESRRRWIFGGAGLSITYFEHHVPLYLYGYSF